MTDTPENMPSPEAKSPEETVTEETPAGTEVEKLVPRGAEAFMPKDAEGGRGRGRGGRGGKGGRDGAPGGRGPRDQQQSQEPDSEWKEKVIQIRRVTKVVKGGKKLSFRAVVVVGNGSGQVGIGLGKSNEVIGAIQKGIAAAKKSLITVPIHKTTIPHPVKAKAGGSVVVLRPASEGTGVIAGGAARALLELAGVENILSKSLGSNSPLNVARATLRGLAELRTFETIAKSRGKSVKEILM
jgi:small subunit ribosomal protein S5